MAEEIIPKVNLKLINGVYCTCNMTPAKLEYISTKLKIRDSDIFIATYPRSGTTWIQNIVEILKTKQKVEGNKHLYQLQPFLSFIEFDEKESNSEVTTFVHPTLSHVEGLADPRVLKTHFVWNFVPKNPNAKYIYMYRNPKDNLVSCYYHSVGKPTLGYTGTLSQYVELYLKGEVECSSWWDHVAGWWEHRNDPNVLILSYEDIYLNFKENVRKIAKFTGFEMDEDLFQLIAAECGLEAMKTNKVFNPLKVPPLPEELKDIVDPQNLHHIRKGGIGGWKNEISESVSKRIDEVTNEKFKNISIKDYLQYD